MISDRLIEAAAAAVLNSDVLLSSLLLPRKKKKIQHHVSIATSRPVGALRHLTSQPITIDDWWFPRPMDCIAVRSIDQQFGLKRKLKPKLLFFFSRNAEIAVTTEIFSFLHWQHLRLSTFEFKDFPGTKHLFSLSVANLRCPIQKQKKVQDDKSH